jgi:hypothetical protein
LAAAGSAADASPSKRDQTPTLPPTGEAELGPLERVGMNGSDDRECRGGRPPPVITRGGSNSPQGVRGGFGGGRGGGSASKPMPALVVVSE